MDAGPTIESASYFMDINKMISEDLYTKQTRSGTMLELTPQFQDIQYTVIKTAVMDKHRVNQNRENAAQLMILDIEKFKQK